MKIALFGKTFPDSFAGDVQQLITKLVLTNCEIIIYAPFLEFLQKKVHLNQRFITFSNYEDFISLKSDIFLSVGGDGTMLETITFIRDSAIPVLGVNTGRLGFLASLSKEDILTAVDDILLNRFSVEKHSLLCLQTNNNLFGDINFALNELTVMKKDTSSMITINMYINNQYLNSYWADGLIVSTPTGSTAYSLSCGGPIITPESENFVITPIASHNLTVRPIVIPDTNEIRIKVDSRSEKYLISLDSRSLTVEHSMELIIKKEQFCINLIRLQGEHFFKTIRNKLMWGQDKRN